MAFEHPTAQDMAYIVTWQEIKERVAKLNPKLKYYGVPRGGQYISAMLNPVDTPEEADCIIDDLIDSGATEQRYKKYDKPFVALFNKQHESKLKNKWLIFPWEQNDKVPIKDNIIRLLEFIGEDPNREGLLETPNRVIRSYKELYSGYKQKPSDVLKTFTEGTCEEMVISKDIDFFSTCEHHLLPFFGKCSIGYIPNGKVVGISKLSRLVEIFSRRLQIQERMTTQIADSLTDALSPLGVIVVCQAKHFCMVSRGVKKINSEMVTSAVRGIFKADVNARQEFMQLIK